MGNRPRWYGIESWRGGKRVDVHAPNSYPDSCDANDTTTQSNGNGTNPSGGNAGGASANQPGIARNGRHDSGAVRERSWLRGTWKDSVELDDLTMLADKRNVISRHERNMRAYLQAAANYGKNGVATTTAPIQETGEDESIINRSPRTTNNNYPVRSDAPWVALIALLLILGLTGLLLWWSTLPKAAQPAPQSGQVQVPGG